MPMKIRRRLLLATAAIGPLAGFGRPAGHAPQAYQGYLRTADSPDIGQMLLTMQSGPTSVGGMIGQLYSMNGAIPGPLIDIKAGQTVRLRVVNALPEATNLHFHGLHVPPDGNADNIFLSIPPGESQDYELAIPHNHPAGLFWYHPHPHGLAAKQVASGLVAPFVIRGDLDRIPEVAAAHEVICVLQDFGWSSGQLFPTTASCCGGSSLTLVSGQLNPEYPIMEGGLLRLRFLNAAADKYYTLGITDHPMHIIATDGGCIPAPEAVDKVTLAPGQRVEVLVRGEARAGPYPILSLPHQGQRESGMGGMGEMGRMGRMGGMGRMGEHAEGSLGAPQPIASIAYRGRSDQAWAIPSRLVEVEALPAPGLPLRQFILGGGGMGHRRGFSINGRPFDASRIDTAVSLNTVEDWEYVNTTQMSHPMHVHTNAFQILDDQGRPERAWRDTVDVGPSSSARIRLRFLDFTGLSAQHCHLLTHEDQGMMATVNIVGPA